MGLKEDGSSQVQAHVPEKNYILCHVRRVMGKKDDDEEDNIALQPK